MMRRVFTRVRAIRNLAASVVFACNFAAGTASAEMHLAELYQSILSCEQMDCVGDAAEFCMTTTEGGYSTFGMMDCTLKERDVWDEQLNLAYKEAREFAKLMDNEDKENFPEFALRGQQVLDAQRAWIAFRDANCTMEYGLWGAGSMRQIAGASCLLDMTARRTLELRNYVELMR